MSQFRDLPNSSPTRPGNQPSARPTPRFRPAFWLILFGVIVPMTILQIPREIGRWHFASAVRYRAKNEPAAAYEQLDRACFWFPDSPELLLQKAEWKLKDGKRDEAFEVADQAVERSKTTVAANFMRGGLRFNAGEFSKAIEDFKKVEEFSRKFGRPPLVEALNQLAYARALEKSDLDKALQEITEALDLMPAKADEPGTMEYYEKGMYLDTRGYILFLKEENEPAVEDLTEAIKRVETKIDPEKTSDEEKRWVSPVEQKLFGAERRATQAKAFAVIYYHRSLALDALGKKEAAAQDRSLVRTLIGREPDETLF